MDHQVHEERHETAAGTGKLVLQIDLLRGIDAKLLLTGHLSMLLQIRISNFWFETRKPHWERLEALVVQCGSGGTVKLSRSDLREFGLLYRQVAADLSILRQDATGTHYARHLNQLLGRAHSIIYMGKKDQPAFAA